MKWIRFDPQKQRNELKKTAPAKSNDERRMFHADNFCEHFAVHWLPYGNRVQDQMLTFVQFGDRLKQKPFHLRKWRRFMCEVLGLPQHWPKLELMPNGWVKDERQPFINESMALTLCHMWTCACVCVCVGLCAFAVRPYSLTFAVSSMCVSLS